MSFHKELEAFSQTLHGSLQGTDQKMQMVLSQMEKDCLDKSSNNCDSFVQCMMKLTKRISKAEKKFEFRLAFFQNQTYECFKQQSESGQSYDKCKSNGKQKINEIVDDFVSSIKL